MHYLTWMVRIIWMTFHLQNYASGKHCPSTLTATDTNMSNASLSLFSLESKLSHSEFTTGAKARHK